MLKLMKYEFKKQILSKMIMAIVLAALVMLFIAATFKSSTELLAVVMVVMLMTLLVSVAYAAIEITVVYEKDLNTKQSYMLFMVPQSAGQILAAKIFSALIQIFAILAVFGIAIGFCLSFYVVYNNGFDGFTQNVKLMLEKLFQVDMNILPILNLIATIIVFWLFFVMLSIFETTVMNTVMKKGKIASFLSGVIYLFVAYLVIVALLEIHDLELQLTLFRILVYSFMIVINIGLFFGTAWLMDKKLSV